MCERAFDGEQARYGCTDFIESGTILPRTFAAVEQDLSMNQARLLRGERFGIEAVALQIAGTLVGKEDVSVFQEPIEFRAIFLGVVQDGLTHPNLRVPRKGLNFGIARPPDVEDVGPVLSEVSANGRSGDHMPHS